VQPDDKIIIGGRFTSVSGETRNRIARLERDGKLDKTLSQGIEGIGAEVYATAVQPDNKIIVGGKFTGFDGATRNNILRLEADGTLDSSFNPNADGDVVSIVVQSDNKILIGGAFSNIGGQPRSRIARLNPDGSLDTNFNPSATGYSNGLVRGIVIQPDNKIIVVGAFTAIGGQVRGGIARINPDGSLDANFAPNCNGAIFSIALQPDGKILVGGNFTFIGDQTRVRLARLDGVTGTADSFVANADGIVRAIAVQPDGKIIVGRRVHEHRRTTARSSRAARRRDRHARLFRPAD
jgi:uncharacterized delta-60 repeat protein